MAVQGGQRQSSSLPAPDAAQARHDPEAGAAWPATARSTLVRSARLEPHHLAYVLRRCTDAGQTGIVVAANRPADALDRDLADRGVRTRLLRYIDCLGGWRQSPLSADGRTLHLESPRMLEAMALRAEQWLQRLPGERFLAVDSMSALAMHAGTGGALEFAQRIVQRAGRTGASVTLLCSDEGLDDAFLHHLGHTCEATVTLAAEAT